jgi:hypothetical protein
LRTVLKWSQLQFRTRMVRSPQVYIKWLPNQAKCLTSIRPNSVWVVGPNNALKRIAATGIGLPGLGIAAVAAAVELRRSASKG